MIAINMKMPESCLQCPLENDQDECSVYNGTLSKGDPKYCTYEYSKHRPDWCPLLQVDKLMVEHVFQQEDFERYGKDTVKKYLIDTTGRKIGDKIVGDMMCEWESKPIDPEFMQFGTRVRTTVCIVRPEISGECSI